MTQILTSGSSLDLGYLRSRTTGIISETAPRVGTSATTTPVAGTYYFHRITLNGVYTTVTVNIPTTAGATLSNVFVALHDVTSLARLAVSADQSTNWQSTGNRTTTLNYTAAPGDYYLGFVIGAGGTIPIITNVGINSAVANLAPIVCGKHNTTGLTAAPDPLVVGAAAAFLHFWMRYE